MRRWILTTVFVLLAVATPALAPQKVSGAAYPVFLSRSLASVAEMKSDQAGSSPRSRTINMLPDVTRDSVDAIDYMPLIERYTPAIYLADGEAYAPASLEDVLEKATLRNASGQGVNYSTLDGSYSGDHYLDLADRGPTLPAVAEATWKYAGPGHETEDRGTVYARIFEEPGNDADTTVIQYWFLYFYNDTGYRNDARDCWLPGLWRQLPHFCGNNHEGDWEMVQVVLKNDVPIGTVYSQHYWPTKRTWEDVEKEGAQPVVYVGLGSHANFFKDALYWTLGVRGTTGHRRVRNLNVEPLPVDDDGNPTQWLAFPGRWGFEQGIGGSPYGPSTNRDLQWDNPIRFWEEAEWDASAY
jgi:hypothetical protein